MDENLNQEPYVTAFGKVINELDPKAADFEFQHSNMRNAVQISGLLTPAEKRTLLSLLYIVYIRRQV